MILRLFSTNKSVYEQVYDHNHRGNNKDTITSMATTKIPKTTTTILNRDDDKSKPSDSDGV